MRGISLTEYAKKHGKSYQRARLLIERLEGQGKAKKVPKGQPGSGSWVISPTAEWVGGERGRPKTAKSA